MEWKLVHYFKCSFSDAHKALELLEQYRKRLDGPENEQLHEALTKAIVTIRSRLFQALLGTLLCLPTATLCNTCALQRTYMYVFTVE